MPSSLASFTVNDSIADLQYFQESELGLLETVTSVVGELRPSSGEYLFPYGFVARSSSTSRSIPVGNNQGTVTLALKLPNSNEPSSTTSSSYPRRFNMTFVVVAEPLSQSRLTESYEERRGTSSASTRATSFGIASSNIARNNAANPSSGVQINGVRTAGNKTNLRHILGERAWQLGTSGEDVARAVATDSSGNVYVTGYTNGSLESTNAGSNDVFLSKYDSSGTLLWTRQQGTSADDFAFGVVTDSSGNVYLSGYTAGALDGNTSAGGNDLFAIKYDSSGTRQWTRQFGGTANDSPNAIALDPSGNLYLAGATGGGFGGASNAGNFDILLARLDALTNIYK
jgi:Beta-propeller repeat